MKSVAYYNQDYEMSVRGLINSVVVLPLLFFVFNSYVYDNDPFLSFVVSFGLASFISLFHFESVAASIVFACGFGMIIAGIIAEGNAGSTYNDRITFLIIFATMVAASMLVYWSNTIQGPVRPDDAGTGDILSPSFMLFAFVFTSLYIALLYR